MSWTTFFSRAVYPDLYKDFCHKVRINYYPPRGDNKEGWDNLDIFGWLGYDMQIKINFLCRDSILAAPLVLDLALFLDLAQRTGMSGTQEWLSFYFKSPMTLPELYPEHDIFIQLMKLKNTLRYLQGEEQITHLGLDYYGALSSTFQVPRTTMRAPRETSPLERWNSRLRAYLEIPVQLVAGSECWCFWRVVPVARSSCT